MEGIQIRFRIFLDIEDVRSDQNEQHCVESGCFCLAGRFETMAREEDAAYAIPLRTPDALNSGLALPPMRFPQIQKKVIPCCSSPFHTAH
jgi:hypothetical protein